jgi:NAD(P)-dependent dehydrogenase (short-subunit alcohol dehydrogenase family)
MCAANTRPLAIITGGSRGLGFETAKALALQGFDLALIAKDSTRLEDAAEKIRTHSASGSQSSAPHISTFVCDLEDPHLVRELMIQSLNLYLLHNC